MGRPFFDRFELLGDPLESMAGDWATKLDLVETKDAVVVTADHVVAVALD